MIIGLAGYAESGKDSVARILCEDFAFVRIAFADPLKAAARQLNPMLTLDVVSCDMFGFRRSRMRLAEIIALVGDDEAKAIPAVRQLYQDLGKCVRDCVYEDVWAHAAFLKVDRLTRAVIPDVRFQNEVDGVRDRGGFLVRVVRPGTFPVNEHVSETAIDHIQPDHTLNNDSDVDGLVSRVEDMLESLGLL